MFPMVAITYRIYSIYNNTSKVGIGKNLKNKRLFIILGILFVIAFIAAIVPAYYVVHFYLKSYGNISTYRHQTCDFNESEIYSYIEYGVFFILFIAIIYMVIKTGKVSKHYGEFNFIYGMLLILIAESVRDFIIPYLPGNGYFTYLIIFFVVYMVYNILCVYIIVGSRLVYAIRHPDQESYKTDSYYTKSTIGLIPKKSKKNKLTSSTTINSNKSLSENTTDENEIPVTIFIEDSNKTLNSNN
ncbi:hypothetical protein PIROE2DRAFT_67769 [Piromyces sp. E2]|nr:hypothetical protein PIROE2DRAFT_67769 [Piromyces sp. E2]|eukprot:OUM58190.1 hypothetical protein PIROE2DRAFT_67769 [Piromyces sp. E2]